MLSGVSEAEAKDQLSRAIAEGQAAVRVTIEASDRHMGGKVLERPRFVVPAGLDSHDIDWMKSRPTAAWEAGPYGAEAYSAVGWGWKQRRIELVEVSTDDVTRIWCGAGERLARRLVREAQPTPELPDWFSAMEAIAWIVSRSAQVVSYAEPERNTSRTFFIEHILPNGERVITADFSPPGMTLSWLDCFAACDPDATLPSGEAVSALLAALRVGSISARATWAATGERKDVGSDEWHGVTFDSPPRNERTLLPYRSTPGVLAMRPEARWQNVLFPRDRLVALWPPNDTDAPIVTTGLASEKHAPGTRERFTIPNKPGGGGKKIAAATEAMVLAVEEQRVPFDHLRRMRQKELDCLYPGAGRTTLAKAREAALTLLSAAGFGDKAAT